LWRAFGTGEADIEHIAAALAQAAAHGGGQRRTRETDVVADRDPPRIYERGVGAADVVGE
jgi:hypothetical protein